MVGLTRGGASSPTVPQAAEQVVSTLTEGAGGDVEDFGREADLYCVRWSATCSVEGEAAAAS